MPVADKIASAEGWEGLSPSDCHQVLRWNQTPIPSVEVRVDEIIRQRCQEFPNRPAVCAWDGEFTYEELDRYSSALASLLVSHGIGTDTFIPLCFEKSRWTAVAMMGVLRAGAAFVLLDPSLPVHRLREICREVAGPVLVAAASCAQIASELSSEVIILDGDKVPSSAPAEGATSSLSDRPRSPMKPSNGSARGIDAQPIAYAVFTSGTTGKPKGLVIQHAAFATMAFARIALIPFTPDTRLLQFSSYAFDVSISDQLLCLMAGSCICVPSETDRQGNLQAFINRHQVNCAFLTCSVARLLVPEKVPSLQILGLGGEKVSRLDIESWSPHVRLLGEYGPAECSVTCAVNLDLARSVEPTNIGFPLAARFWVVEPEDHNRLVALGAEGELVVEGPILARGYLNHPELTAAAFVCPTWLAALRGDQPSRVYRTGDLVRYNSDGSLVYLGRKDAQVKINGQRVELEDIEHHVLECFSEAQDVVAEIVSLGSSTSSTVVAFVAFVSDITDGNHPSPRDSESDSDSDSDNLFRRPCKLFHTRIQEAEVVLPQRLPRYMVPSLFIPVHLIPVNPSGKADRRRLRETVMSLDPGQLAAYRGEGRGEASQSLNAMEEKLQRLWAQILQIGTETVGRYSNWWCLGGDSLLAIKLIGELQKEFLVMTVQEMFQHPILSDMATVISHDVTSSLIPVPGRFELLGNEPAARMEYARSVAEGCGLSMEEVDDIYPCSTSQELIVQMSEHKLGNFTLLFEGELRPEIDRGRFASAWHKAVRANPMLRTRVVPNRVDGKLLQVLVKGATVPIESLASRDGDYDGTFDIWDYNQALIRLATVGNRFLILIHHVAYDLFSFSQLFVQLRRAYEGHALPTRPYSPFVKWEQALVPATTQFWTQKLAGFKGRMFPPSLPCSSDSPPVHARRECRFPISIEASSQSSVTSKLYLALAVVLSCALDEWDIIFGGSFVRRGAPVPDIMEIMGPTTCLLPLRIQLDNRQTLQQSQQRILNDLLETAQFDGADMSRISQLSADAAAACQIRTACVVLQEDMLTTASRFFSQTWQHHNMVFPIGLILMCTVSKDSVLVQTMYDQNLLESTKMQQLLGRLAQAVQFIGEQPETKIGDVKFRAEVEVESTNGSLNRAL
jgi:amino acid adenylation domain-containing protein